MDQNIQCMYSVTNFHWVGEEGEVFLRQNGRLSCCCHSLQCRRNLGVEYGTQDKLVRCRHWIVTGCLTGRELVQRWGLANISLPQSSRVNESKMAAYIYSLLVHKIAQYPNIINKLQNDFNFSIDQLRQIFSLPHSVVLESYVKGFQFKVLNSILYTNSKLHKIGFKTDDPCSFCKAEPETLYHHFLSMFLWQMVLERVLRLLAPNL